MENQPIPNSRYANLEELTGYAEYHEDIILRSVHGLAELEVNEDKEGAFLELRVKNIPNDQRTLNVEQTAGLLKWPTFEGEIKIRVKVVDLDRLDK